MILAKPRWTHYCYDCSCFQPDGVSVGLNGDCSPGNGTHSSTLAWKIPWTEEPDRLQSMGSLRVGHVHGVAKSWTLLSDFTFTFHFHALEKEMATHSSVLAWRIPGTGEPGGLTSMGSHRVGHDWSDLTATAAPNRPTCIAGISGHFLHSLFTGCRGLCRNKGRRIYMFHGA